MRFPGEDYCKIRIATLPCNFFTPCTLYSFRWLPVREYKLHKQPEHNSHLNKVSTPFENATILEVCRLGGFMQDRLNAAWWSLRLAFFLGPFIAGLDKFLHLLTNWDKYLSPMARNLLGSYSHDFMLVAGVIEMIVGLMVITRWPRLGAYIASLWLLLIAINLVMTGQYFDIALRDIGLCLCAFGLAKLTEAMARTASRMRRDLMAA